GRLLPDRGVPRLAADAVAADVEEPVTLADEAVELRLVLRRREAVPRDPRRAGGLLPDRRVERLVADRIAADLDEPVPARAERVERALVLGRRQPVSCDPCAGHADSPPEGNEVTDRPPAAPLRAGRALERLSSCARPTGRVIRALSSTTGESSQGGYEGAGGEGGSCVHVHRGAPTRPRGAPGRARGREQPLARLARTSRPRGEGCVVCARRRARD